MAAKRSSKKKSTTKKKPAASRKAPAKKAPAKKAAKKTTKRKPVPRKSAADDRLSQLERLVEHALNQSQWAKANRPKNAIGQLMQPLYRAGLTEIEVHAWMSAMGKIYRPRDPDAS